MPTYFFTGFPGFLATQIIHFLAKNDSTSNFQLLVHPSQMYKAKQVAQVLSSTYGGERFSLLAGDITTPDFGLNPSITKALQNEVHFVFHLAAVYDLAVPQDTAYKVNVVGTKMVCSWVRKLENLKRFVYFSTAYVSGTRRNRVLESELSMGQSFKNHYESTKYVAEVNVQGLMPSVPITIIRPAIVVGDSRTGETVKFDGPYFIMRFLERFRHLPIPTFGSPDAYLNVVPVDYIVQATCHLAHYDGGAGKVYHLTDPRPYLAADVHRMISEELLGRSPSYRIPSTLVAGVLSIPMVRRYFQVEKQAIAYFQCDTLYDSSEAIRDLSALGIRCPDLKNYVRTMVNYYKLHRHDETKRIVVY